VALVYSTSLLEVFAICSTVIVVVIVIGGLKSRGLTNTPIVCAKRDLSYRDPDYPWTIDAQRC